jgi:hypothetical protein
MNNEYYSRCINTKFTFGAQLLALLLLGGGGVLGAWSAEGEYIHTHTKTHIQICGSRSSQKCHIPSLLRSGIRIMSIHADKILLRYHDKETAESTLQTVV